MNIKSLLYICLFTGLPATALHAQELYDVSEAYLTNNMFDTDYHYTSSEEGDVQLSDIHQLPYWTLNANTTVGITGVYQLGTKKTFATHQVPATGFDGTSNGGVLVFYPEVSYAAIYYQSNILPPGDYKLVYAMWNPGPQTIITSVSSYISKTPRGIRSRSGVTAVETEQWVTDTLSFTLTEPTTGEIALGFSVRQAQHSGIVVDWMRLLRTTPLSDTDRQLLTDQLQGTIDAATTAYGTGEGNGAEALQAAIEQAQGILADDASTLEALKLANYDLQQAITAFEWSSRVSVQTNTRYARGANQAFGRITVSGASATDIAEQGLVFATHENPTVDDAKTTDYLTNNGNIYWMKGLQPATLYYMRGYAMSNDGAVSYGNTVKFYTIPRGQLTYSIRDGGDEATKTRITNATKDAVGLWNDFTQLKGVHFNVGYESGTPTADCSYGGWIRVGPNTAYQATGTLLHEMLHGIGVIPWNGTQWAQTNLRASTQSSNAGVTGSGDWLGDRVSEVLRFWDNNATATLHGDYQHMWPYGINGASEDNHSSLLYIGNSLVCEALAEDGLETSYSYHGVPYYAFDCQDGVKYYLKSENEANGRYTAFLTEDATGRLVWREMEADEAALNDSTAWLISFNPASQLYQLCNAKTGHYITHLTSGITTRPTQTADADFQLMKGRVDVTEQAFRGYWILHPTVSNWSPNCLTAATNNRTISSGLNLNNNAINQRWLILTDEEMRSINTYTNGIDGLQADENATPTDGKVYNLGGQQVRQTGNGTRGLHQGIYIVNGKKVIVK